jgi:poly(ADP-ribose) glycohydrolase ARH3
VASAAAQIFDGQGSRGNARSARITHAHAVGIDGAVVQAAAITAALRDDDVLEVARSAARTRDMTDGLGDVSELLAAPPDLEAVQARLGSSSDARQSVCAAIYSALAHDTFDAALRFAVGLGGDTDTVAAMAGAVSAARHGEEAIPGDWLAALEDDTHGRTYVEDLAEQLLAMRRGHQGV